MRTWLAGLRPPLGRFAKTVAVCAVLTFVLVFVSTLLNGTVALAQSTADTAGGEAGLKLPDLSQVSFLGIDGHKLLTIGILFCVFGLIFGLVIYNRLKNLL